MTSAVFGCGSADVVTCGRPPQFGIQLRIQDASTLANLNGVATVTITRLDPPQDSLSGYWGDVVRLTQDAPGNFRLRVEAADYIAATREVSVPRSTRTCFVLVTQSVVLPLQHK